MLAALALFACTERVPPPKVKSRDPSHEFRDLLKRAASAEGVDYALLRAERHTVARAVAWVARHGPFSDDWGESKENRRIAFGMNAHNILAIWAVLERDVRVDLREIDIAGHEPGLPSLTEGLRFRVDRTWRSLDRFGRVLTVERHQDPRLWVGLHLPQQGSPRLVFFNETTVDVQVDRLIRSLLANDGMRPTSDGGWALHPVFVDHARDFTDWSREPTVCGYLAPYAPPGERRVWLEEHRLDCPVATWTLTTALDVTDGEEEPVDPDDLFADDYEEAELDDEEEPVDDDGDTPPTPRPDDEDLTDEPDPPAADAPEPPAADDGPAGP